MRLLRWTSALVAAGLTLAGSAPPAGAEAYRVAGECEVLLRVERAFGEVTLTPARPGDCTTTEGDATIEISGRAEGFPGLTCAGGYAGGVGRVEVRTPGRSISAPGSDLRFANAGGVVEMTLVKVNASVRIVVSGVLVQSSTAAHACLTNANPVNWWGHVTFESHALT